MFRERNEWPSTAGEAEERSGYMELGEVPGSIDFSMPRFRRRDHRIGAEEILWCAEQGNEVRCNLSEFCALITQ